MSGIASNPRTPDPDWTPSNELEAIAQALGRRIYGSVHAPAPVEEYRSPRHTRWPWLLDLAAAVIAVRHERRRAA